MATSYPRILIGSIVFFVIVAAGISVGQWYLTSRAADQRATLNAENHGDSHDDHGHGKHVPPPHGAPLTNYSISPPSTGVYLRKKEIEVTKNTLFPTTPVLKDSVGDFTKGKKIVFYDDQNIALEMIGEIIDILPPEGDRKETLAMIEVRTLDADLTKKIAKAYLVLGKDKDVQRVPKTALVEGKDGKRDTLWVISYDKYGYVTAQPVRADIIAEDTDFVVLAADSEASKRDIITNPDEKLKPGSLIQGDKDYYKGPPVTDEERITKKIQERMDEAAEKQRQLETEAAAAEAAAADRAGSCKGGITGQNFIECSLGIANPDIGNNGADDMGDMSGADGDQSFSP